jgi:hypothetical protein
LPPERCQRKAEKNRGREQRGRDLQGEIHSVVRGVENLSDASSKSLSYERSIGLQASHLSSIHRLKEKNNGRAHDCGWWRRKLWSPTTTAREQREGVM